MNETGWSIRFRYLMLGVVILILVGFIGYARVAVGPLVISGLIAYVLSPVVDFMTSRTRVTRRWAVIIVFILALTLLLASVSIIVPVIFQQVQRVIVDIDVFLLNVQEFFSRDYIVLGQRISLQQFVPDISRFISESLAGIPSDAFHLLESTTRNILWSLVILATTLALLQDWTRLREWLIHLAPLSYQGDVRRLYDQIKRIWRGYLRGNLALMGITAILFTIAWFAIGVPGAIVLSLTAGVLAIIPDLGPAIAAILAALVALVEGSTYLGLSNFWFAVLVLVVYVVLVNAANIWIRPRIFGRSVHMHGAIVFVAIVAAVVIQGILGALIVIPVLASAGVIGGYVWRRILGEDPFPEKEPAAVPPAEDRPVAKFE